MFGGSKRGIEVPVLAGIGAALLTRLHDRLKWWLEVAPVVVGIPLLLDCWARWPLTRLLYRMLIIGEAADSFLATHSDIWNTRWDMFLALCGAIVSLLLLSCLHDRQLHRLTARVLIHNYNYAGESRAFNPDWFLRIRRNQTRASAPRPCCFPGG